MFDKFFSSYGKYLMILGISCFIAGICIFPFYNDVETYVNHRMGLGVGLLQWMMERLGKYGFCGFFVIGGLIIALRGFFLSKNDKRPVE